MKNSSSQTKNSSPPDKNAQLSDRVREIFESRGGAIRVLCAEIGWNEPAYHAMKSKGTRPPASILGSMVEVWGVDANWLLTGRGTEPTTPLALDDPSLEGLGGVALVFAMYPEARKRIVDNARRLAKAIEDERREGGPNQHPPLYQ